MMQTITTLIALLALTGCDANYEAAGPVTVCTESGVQCTLAKGPLGVCERAPCQGDETPPCYRCTSQH